MDRVSKKSRFEIKLFPEIPLAFLVIFFVVYRLFFGVDFSDQSYLLAICSHYLAGAIPFVDEYALHQSAVFPIYPFIKLYYSFFGFEGIALYARFVMLFLYATGSAFIVYFLRGSLSVYGSFLLALYVLSARPHHDSSLSYNTLACIFTTISFFGFYRAMRDHSKTIFCVAMGFLFLCCLSYPSCVILVPYFLFLGRNIFPLRLYLIFIIVSSAILIASAVFVFSHFSFYINDWLSFVDFAIEYVYRGRKDALLSVKINSLINTLKNKQVMLHYLLMSILFYFFYVKKLNLKKIFLPISILLLLSLSFFHAYRHNEPTDHLLIAFFSWLAPFYYLYLGDEDKKMHLLSMVGVPSLIMTFLYIVSTGTKGTTHLSLGFYPLSLVTLVYYIKAISGKSKVWFSPIYALIFYLIYFQYTSIYRDDHFLQLNTQIQYGPYKGLYTTSKKKTYIDEVKKQLDIIKTNPEKPNGILFAYSFSGGYLMSDLPPLAPAVWLVPQISYEFYDNYFKSYGRKIPDFIFTMQRIPFGAERYEPFSSGSTPIQQFLEKKLYQRSYHSKNFAVYKIEHHIKNKQ